MQMPGKGLNSPGVYYAWPKERAIMKLWSPQEVGPGILMHFQCITQLPLILILLSVCDESMVWYSEQNLFWKVCCPMIDISFF